MRSKDESSLPSIKAFPMSWVLDTGATSHMVANISDFTDYQPIQPRWISGLCARAVGIGTVRLRLPDSCGVAVSTVLHNVLHVPDLAYRSDGHIMRLFSSRQAHEQNKDLQIVIANGNRRMQLGDTVFPVHAVNRLSVLHSYIAHPALPTNAALLSSMQHSPKYLWHARLGHVHVRAMDALRGSSTTGVTYSSSGRLPFCHACAMVKATAATRPRSCRARPPTPGDLMGCNFWENRTRSLQARQPQRLRRR